MMKRLRDIDIRDGFVEPELTSDKIRSQERWNNLVANVRTMIREQLVDPQLQLFNDSNTWVVACCARQCGKTYTVARLMIDVALERPDRICSYVSDTRENAFKTMWLDQIDGLPAVLHDFGFDEEQGDYKINLSTLTITFRNGSVLELTGADRGAWAKFRGRKLDLIVADEMQRQHDSSLEETLRQHIPDCLMARKGRFVGIGTVSRALSGLWFRLNGASHQHCEPTPGWTCHRWTAEDLSSVTNVWESQLADARALGIDTDPETGDPTFRRERLGLWVRDDVALLHSVGERSVWNGQLPDTVRTKCPDPTHSHLRNRCRCDVPYVPRSVTASGQMQVYAGLDLGFNDSNGVVVGSISREEGILRELHSEERPGLDTAQLADWLHRLKDEHGIIKFYSDPAWKQTVEDLRRLYGVPIEAATKGDAEGTTEDLWHAERQAALRDGSFQVMEDSVLHQQLEKLLRDPVIAERDGHIRTAPGQVDHVTDAWRYLFRMVRTKHVAAPEAPMTSEQIRRLEIEEVRRRSLGTDDRGSRRSVGQVGARPSQGNAKTRWNK